MVEEGVIIREGGSAHPNSAPFWSEQRSGSAFVRSKEPGVAGQHQTYLQSQLIAFKKGERKGYNEMMSSIAFRLSEQEIKALSVYMSGLN